MVLQHASRLVVSRECQRGSIQAACPQGSARQCPTLGEPRVAKLQVLQCKRIMLQRDNHHLDWTLKSGHGERPHLEERFSAKRSQRPQSDCSLCQSYSDKIL